MKQQDQILKIYQQYHDPQYLTFDPLFVATRFKGTTDLEVVSLISALFAFGGVKQILTSIESALKLLNVEQGGLVQLLNDSSSQELQKIFSERLKNFRHRIYVGDDLAMLLLIYQASIKRYGNLKTHFLSFHSAEAETIEQGLSGLIRDFKKLSQEITYPHGRFFSHMLNSPESKSACKRWVMYLKWMVRPDDGLDLGLWNGEKNLRSDQLVIPLDTHLLNISKRLLLTKKNTPNWAMALEVTRNLKKLDPLDPTRFDFSLCRWGMFEYRKMHK